jgi:Cu-Zn family superoxide dismutase
MKAICVLDVGEIIFKQNSPSENVSVYINLYNLKPNAIHGFHIHQYGDISNGCDSLGPHFNPYNKKHGSITYNKYNRHVGDLINNIYVDRNGNVNYYFEDNLISLYGENSIIGRSIVIHNNKDDLGIGKNEESKKSGNAGKRIYCGIIGIANPNYL